MFLVLLGLSATYAGIKKTTKYGVFDNSNSIGAGSLIASHLHGHGNVIENIDPSSDPVTAAAGSFHSANHAGVAAGPNIRVAGSATAPVVSPGIAGSGPVTVSQSEIALGTPAAVSVRTGTAIGTTQIDLGSVVQEHVHVINRVGIPVAQPYAIPVERAIPVSVPHPVDVPVDRPYPVHVPVRYQIKIIKNVPVPVDKPIPVPVKVSVKVPVEVPFKVYHPYPVAVPVEQGIPIPVPDPVIVKKSIPVVGHAHFKPIINVDHVNFHH